ncbi:MAG: isoprenylcysteine carboxylmethyltransferase family protein [Acidobacteriota bacterium]
MHSAELLTVRLAFGAFFAVIVVFCTLRGFVTWWQTGRSPFVAVTGGRLNLDFVEVMGLATWLALVLHYAVKGPFGPWVFKGAVYPYLHYVGLLCIALACAIFAGAIKRLGRSWRIGIDREHPGDLVSTGIYGLVRHPIYLALQLAASGIFGMAPNVTFGICALLVVAGTWRQAYAEEAFLAVRYPDTYPAYMRETGRFLPKLFS